MPGVDVPPKRLNTMRVPSGEGDGTVSKTSPLSVSRRRSPPSAFIVQMSGGSFVGGIRTKTILPLTPGKVAPAVAGALAITARPARTDVTMRARLNMAVSIQRSGRALVERGRFAGVDACAAPRAP